MFGMFRQAQIQAQWLARCTCNASRNRRRPSSRDALARTLALAVVITGVQLRGSARALGRVDEAYRYNQLLGRGINLGNALEAPQEGAWGVTLKTHYFQDRSAMRSPRWSGSPRRGIRPASKGCRLQAHADRRPRILERRRSPRQPALAGKRPADDRYLPLLYYAPFGAAGWIPAATLGKVRRGKVRRRSRRRSRATSTKLQSGHQETSGPSMSENSASTGRRIWHRGRDGQKALSERRKPGLSWWYWDFAQICPLRPTCAEVVEAASGLANGQSQCGRS